MPAFEFSIAATDGQQLFTREWKPERAARAVIVLIHGLGEHGGRYEHVAAALNAAGYAVILPDLRGHGQTKGTRGHIPSYDVAIQDIECVLKIAAQRHPGRPLFLYGHSMGGNLALAALLKRKPKLRGAVISSPGLAPTMPVNPVKLALGKLLYRLLPSFTFHNGLELAGLSRDPSVTEKAKADPYYHDRVSARLGLDFIQAGRWIQTQTGPVDIPLLIMHGTADRLADRSATQKFAEQLAGPVTYLEWPGAFHELHNEPDKDQVIQTIVGWLNERLARTGSV